MEHKVIFRHYHPRKDFETVKGSCGKKFHTWWMMEEELQKHKNETSTYNANIK